MVARLEEFPRTSIEHSGAQEVVRYRGQILPLIRVSKHVPSVTNDSVETELMQVVVYSEQGRSVGLVVGRINDIVPFTRKGLDDVAVGSDPQGCVAKPLRQLHPREVRARSLRQIEQLYGLCDRVGRDVSHQLGLSDMVARRVARGRKQCDGRIAQVLRCTTGCGAARTVQ